MCRFVVRNGQAAQAPPEQPKLDAPLDLDTLFDDGNDLDAQDLALLALFNNGTAAQAGDNAAGSASSTAGPPTDAQSSGVVLGQALTAPQPAALAVPVAPPMPAPAVAAPLAPNPVQQLQFQAVMQHQAAIMQNPAAYPAAAVAYQQALLAQQQQAVAQQHMMAAAAGSVALPLAAPPMPAPALGSKRGKTQAEVEEQTERIKKRRRESAQRSRQRKNAYMKSLEMENRALKMENERLRAELSKSTGGAGTLGLGTAAGTGTVAAGPKASSGSVSRREPSVDACSGQGTDMSDDEDLCDPVGLVGGVGGLAGSAAAQLHAAGCADPLELMPTADLLNFAF